MRWTMAVRRRSRRDSTAVSSLLQWLLLGAMLGTVATARTVPDTDFGLPTYGLLIYRSAEGSVHPYCTIVSTRFRLPPMYEKEEDVYRGVEFRYANQSCQLDLTSASAKHVFLVLPLKDKPCPFEDSLAQAVSAKAYSLIVARDIDHKPHANYFASGENNTVPVQDITVGVMRLDIVESFKSIHSVKLAAHKFWDAGDPATNVSYSGGDTAQLYVLELNLTIGASLIWIMACSTVAIGALWAGSTRKLLYLTRQRRIPPKEKQRHKEDAELDAVPVRVADSAVSLGTNPKVPRPVPSTTSTTKVRSESHHRHHGSRARPSKSADDFPSSDKDALDEDITFAECPVDFNLLTMFVLMLAVNLLVLYYFFNKLCYGASLVFTFFMGQLMNTGQPALLYLVPGIVLPVTLLAWCRGELKQFWNGDFVPKEGLTSPHLDVCVSSSEQFQMHQSRGLLYVTTPVFPWLAVPMPVSQKAYDAKSY
ncbi:hypothetical protein HPB50_003800 [Hyalomma asiaticum]|uniref:Uncharacterized protein n=1 Tax=Hyalomma asiaticum TaxID=266040 RepID=A0ACB7S7D3_HYAAI|nr:hypothetical protein HPB50_003800 [Hyalomma asiaticum]